MMAQFAACRRIRCAAPRQRSCFGHIEDPSLYPVLPAL